MPPKFQSSFIPKGSLTAPAGIVPTRVKKQGSLLGLIAVLVFITAVVLSVAVFGYHWFLKYRISHMASDLEAARSAIDPETIRDLARLDARLTATKGLLESHSVLTPLFTYLEASTPTAVRFNNFSFGETNDGKLELVMRGQARSYSALALQADIFNKGEYVKDPIFSELNLDDKGNVTFSVRAGIGPALVSYVRNFEKRGAAVSAPVAGSSSTSTPVTASSTPSGQATSTKR